MTDTIKDIIYFTEPGPANSEKILKMAIKRIDELGIKQVIIASATGATVNKFLEMTERDKKYHVLAVTNVKGGKLPVSIIYKKYKESRKIRENYEKMGITHFNASIDDETREELENKGVKVLYLSDILNIGGGPSSENLEDAEEDWKRRREKLSPFIPAHLRPLDLEAGEDLSLLNIISMGFRVAVGVTAASVKCNLVSQGDIVLSIAGTGFAGGGVDTAIIMEARANPKACWVKEIIGFPQSK